MTIAGNPQVEHVWPADEFRYGTDGGKERSVELQFTPADFVYNDVRFEEHFWHVDAAKWHEKMTPLHDYLAMSPGEIEDRVPYIATVDADGHVARVAVTHHVVDMVRRIAALWRTTQEWGGVDNSFARILVEEEKARLEEEKQREIAEIEKKYAANLDRDLGDLTQEIVQRIAARLLAEGGEVPTSLSMPSAPVKAAATEAPAQEAPAEEVPVEEEEDDIVVTEDPYIDTPLCTSCNECTKINGLMFKYDDNKQAYIADPDAGTFRELVMAAEKCPVKIIHPGKPRDPSESGLDDLVKRAEPFN
jgi:ferredoxin